MMTIAQQLPGFLQRNSALLPRLLSYLLVVLIAMSSAKLVWSLFSGDSTSDAVSEVKSAPPKALVKPSAPRPDYGSQVASTSLLLSG